MYRDAPHTFKNTFPIEDNRKQRFANRLEHERDDENEGGNRQHPYNRQSRLVVLIEGKLLSPKQFADERMIRNKIHPQSPRCHGIDQSRAEPHTGEGDEHTKTDT